MYIVIYEETLTGVLKLDPTVYHNIHAARRNAESYANGFVIPIAQVNVY